MIVISSRLLWKLLSSLRRVQHHANDTLRSPPVRLLTTYVAVHSAGRMLLYSATCYELLTLPQLLEGP